MSEITGKVFKIGQERSFSKKSGETVNEVQLIVEDTSGKFPKKLALTCSGETYQFAKESRIGDNVKIQYNIESREWQEKWFTECKAWKAARV